MLYDGSRGYACLVHTRHMPSTPGIQMNVPTTYHNAFPQIITSSGPRNLSTTTFYECWRSLNFPFSSPNKWDNNMHPT